MSPAEAAKAYRKQRKFFDDPKIKARRREFEAAEKVLKEHFRARPKLDRYQGVTCSRSPRPYFNAPAARAFLGAKAAQFEEDRTALTLGIT